MNMSNTEEFIKSCRELNIEYKLVESSPAHDYIERVLAKFKPRKISGHLAIDHSSRSIPVNQHEFSYSNKLPNTHGYVFFDQTTEKYKLIEIPDTRLVCKIIENSFGMEYFLSDREMTYLIAVNWYVIEFSGVDLPDIE